MIESTRRILWFALVLGFGLTAAARAPVFEENFDSLGQGGDGMNSFVLGPLFAVNDEASIEGSRCQYSDQDGPNPNPRDPALCVPSTASDWHVHLPAGSPAPKAFSGDAALHMGTHEASGDPDQDSYTTAQISAAVSPVLTLGARGPASKLTFWHIVALADDLTFGAIPVGQTADRAVVQVALADPLTGGVASDWQTIQAERNGMTKTVTDGLINCMFDPIDDGSTEDDFFDPADPNRRLGPSSTCSPRLAFGRIGDWTSTNRKDVGDATDAKVGRLGSLGTGVWIQSSYDLGPFEGQSIRIRFLFSGIEVNGPDGGTWTGLFGPLGNGTRGWIIDDVKVTNAARSVP